MNDTDLAAWAAQQPLACELVEGRLVLSAEHHQAPAGLAALRHIANGVFGNPDQADAWLATPSPDFGGLAPADLTNDSEEGSQLVLRTLIRWHRATLEPGDG